MGFPQSSNIIEKIGSLRPIRRVGVVALAILILITLYLLITYRAPTGVGPVQLEDAVRPGSSEFEQAHQAITVAKPVALTSPSAFGDLVVELNTTVRNDTGRRIRGLEMHGAMLNGQGLTVAERTVIPIPAQQAVLEPGETVNVQIRLEGISAETDRSDVKVDITGVVFD